MARKRKKKDNEYWRKKAVTLAKRLARERDNFTCRYCGKSEPLISTHGSHVFAEGIYKSMSADVDNIICLCASHHAIVPGRRINGWNWHAAPAEAIIWFQGKFPELWQTLKERTQKNYQVDFQKKYEELRQE